MSEDNQPTISIKPRARLDPKSKAEFLEHLSMGVPREASCALVGITAQGLVELVRGQGAKAKSLRAEVAYAEALAQAKLVAKAMSGTPRDALALLQTRYPGWGRSTSAHKSDGDKMTRALLAGLESVPEVRRN